MLTINEVKNTYVQPECEVIQVLEMQMIAINGSTNEEYEKGSTDNWF